MTSRDRILARRARFVAAAVALAGCRDPEPPPPRVPVAPPPTAANSALAGPPKSVEVEPIDTDHDGVPDERDKCPGVPGTKDGCPSPCLMIIAPSKLEIRERIYFARGSSTLVPEASPALDAIAAAVKDNALVVEVQGHAELGESGTIGEARAKAVRDALIKRGVDAGRLSVKDFGQTAPLKSGLDPSNRRVEFEVK